MSFFGRDPFFAADPFANDPFFSGECLLPCVGCSCQCQAHLADAITTAGAFGGAQRQQQQQSAHPHHHHGRHHRPGPVVEEVAEDDDVADTPTSQHSRHSAPRVEEPDDDGTHTFSKSIVLVVVGSCELRAAAQTLRRCDNSSSRRIVDTPDNRSPEVC